MEDSNQLLNSFVYLLAIVLAVPGARRLGLGPVLGYLVAGVLIGPWGLALIRNAGDISLLSAISASALLFLAGFELRLNMFSKLGHALVIKGALFWGLSFLLFSLVGISLDIAWHQAVAVALALSFTSHTLVLHFLKHRNLFNTPRGYSVQSILLTQSILVLPLLVLLPTLGFGSTSQESLGWLGMARVLLVVTAILVAGRYVLRHAFRYVMALGLSDIFAAFVLLLVIGLVLLMQSVGASLFTGAFLAGYLVGSSESRKELESVIEPLKGLLLGLFFLSMGLVIDFGLLLKYPHIVLAVLVVMALVKILLVLIMGYFESSGQGQGREHLLPALLVAPAGELSCVLLVVAMSYQALGAELGAGMIVVVALSMLITPLLQIFYNRRVSSELRSLSGGLRTVQRNPVLIIGFGRVGQVVGRMLKSANIDAAVVDYDPIRLKSIEDFGFAAFAGDALRRDLLEVAGINEASVVVIAIDDQDRTVKLASMIKSFWPGALMVARCHDRLHHRVLSALGVNACHRETFEAAVLIGEDVLNCLGTDIDETERISEAFRDHDERLLTQEIDHFFSASQADVESPSNGVGTHGMRADNSKRLAREELHSLLQRDQSAYEKEQELKIAGD